MYGHMAGQIKNRSKSGVDRWLDGRCEHERLKHLLTRSYISDRSLKLAF